MKNSKEIIQKQFVEIIVVIFVLSNCNCGQFARSSALTYAAVYDVL